MAHAFDNRNFTHEKQQTLYSVDSLSSSSRRDMKNDRWESSLSSQLNHLPPSYQDTIHNKPLVNHQNSISSQNDSSYCLRRQQPRTDDYLLMTSGNGSSETKPPPPARVPRIISTPNNYTRRSNLSSQYSTNGTKTNTTYLNTTQLYISEPPPPPPPPRHPLSPPAIPPRNPIIPCQKNSITIPDFNSSLSPKVIYRSPVPFSTSERNHSNDQHFLQPQLNPLTIDTNPPIRDSINGSTVGEYFGACRKCGETITSLDDPCDLLGQIYHGSCAVCVLCGQSVKNKHFYIKDQLYCEDDFLNTGVLQTFSHCVACHRLINDTIVQAIGDTYHLMCFKCSKCSIDLDGKPFIRDKNRQLFCLHDYHITYGQRCDKCTKPILPEDDTYETVRIVSMGKTFHIECYQCEDCSMPLGDEEDRRCHPLDDLLLCQECFYQRFYSMNKF